MIVVRINQLAEHLGVHRNTIRNWIRSGRLPARSASGKRYLITEEDFGKLCCEFGLNRSAVSLKQASAGPVMEREFSAMDVNFRQVGVRSDRLRANPQWGQISADAYMIRDRVQRRLLAEADGEVDLSHIPQMHQMIETLFNRVLSEENLLYTRAVRARLLDWVIADILGFGPLEPLLQETSITEVMVNGFDNVYIERFGKVEKTKVSFENEGHLMRIIDRIVAPLGRRVDESSPMVDARLPNGYRVNVIIPPLSLIGPMLTIRKFAQTPFTPKTDLAGR